MSNTYLIPIFFISFLIYTIFSGNTPLHTAVHNSHTEIAKYLVASGADEFKRNLSGLTPFQLVGKWKTIQTNIEIKNVILNFFFKLFPILYQYLNYFKVSIIKSFSNPNAKSEKNDSSFISLIVELIDRNDK